MNEHLTIPAAFFDSENDKALPALLQRTSGKTHAIKRGEFEEKVKRVALGLVSSGIKPFETVAIPSEKRKNCSYSRIRTASRLFFPRITVRARSRPQKKSHRFAS